MISSRQGGGAARLFVVLVAVVATVVGTWTALQRTLIPLAVGGVLAEIGVYSDSGQQLGLLELEGGETLVVDVNLAEELNDLRYATEGPLVLEKRRWTTSLSEPRGVELTALLWRGEALRFLALGVSMSVLAAWRVRRAGFEAVERARSVTSTG